MQDANEMKFDNKGSLGDEDDARTSNTCIVQKKRPIPHSAMKNMTSVDPVTLDDDN